MSALTPASALRSTAERPREEQTRLEALAANLPRSALYQVVEYADGSLCFTEMSSSVQRILGLRSEDILRDATVLYGRVHPDDQPELQTRRRTALESRRPFEMTVRIRHVNGQWRWMQLSSQPRWHPDDHVFFDGVMTDITDAQEALEQRRLLEQQLREAQKMESIGTLASGIAHDFNNILSAIVGNAAMAKVDAERGDTAEAARAAEQVLVAARRARELVRKILTFSRQHEPDAVTQPLLPIVDETASLLRATLPAHVTVKTEVTDAAVQARVDATQISQVLMNLCTNAWQALGDGGGLIELGLGTALLDANTAMAADTLTGPCVHLWVQDNGSGMDAETQRRVFEPFFTTKPIGRGTGLGMAVVHGIVQGHGGGIRLTSDVGVGTRFDVYLPAVADAGATAPADTPSPPALLELGHGEHVLYVDDDEVISMMAERLLGHAGYAATTCVDPQAALAMLEQEPARFRVLATDYNMPTMSGLDLIRKAWSIAPGLRMVLLSGSVTEELTAVATSEGVYSVVEKQYLYEQLPQVVAHALAGERQRHSV